MSCVYRIDDALDMEGVATRSFRRRIGELLGMKFPT